MISQVQERYYGITQKFTSSGTFKVPSGCRSVNLWLVGGGGGSGRCGHAGGGGGGGGEVINTIIQVTPNSSISYTIGSGGYNGRSDGVSSYGSIEGTNGGDTTFGSAVARGGYFGGNARGSYSWQGNDGGQFSKKGGNGGYGANYGNTAPTNGEEGVTIPGYGVFGSGGGGGGTFYAASWDGTQYPSAYGGTNAGDGLNNLDSDVQNSPYNQTWTNEERMSFISTSRCKAKDGYGGGGGAVPNITNNYVYFRSGGSGCIIINY